MQGTTVGITGASMGIGAACAREFAAQGASLLLCSRSSEGVQQLAHELQHEYDVPTYAFALDVRQRQQVEQALQELPAQWQAIDILINNAGLALGLEPLQDGSLDDWEQMIDTNVKGLLYMTRAIVPGMIQRKRGHIINIGSLAGRYAYPGAAVYCGTKAAVRAITDGLRMDLVDTPLRVTDLQPGMTETNFSNVRFHGDSSRASQVYRDIEPLQAEDVAQTALFIATRPAHVQIQEVLMTCTHQAASTVVHRPGK
nr:SDR family NAD(P)-dependent oxidoreductase [Desulfurispira natronophila]